MSHRASRRVRHVSRFLTSRPDRTALVAAVGLVAVGVAVWLWERGPNLVLDTRNGLDAVGQHWATLLQVTAASGGVIAGAYTARNYRLSRRGQTTDRFTKALERLGSADLYVRIGGVYALEQVLRDSVEHHANVVDVLVEFIRARTRLTAPSQTHRDSTTHWGVHAVALSAMPSVPDQPAEPHSDIQAALTVLSRIPHRGRPTTSLNLTNLHLAGAKLARADFTGALLDRTNLTEAVLLRANLTRAELNGANLTHAVLEEANLARAGLCETNLTNAQLARADLTGALLDRAKLADAWLVGADLTSARLLGANLTRAVLSVANLTGAWLSKADFTGARLDQANLTRALLDRADFTDAELYGANLAHAQLAKAKITADQANTAARIHQAELPAHLIWDPQPRQVRDATPAEAAVTTAKHQRCYPWTV